MLEYIHAPVYDTSVYINNIQMSQSTRLLFLILLLHYDRCKWRSQRPGFVLWTRFGMDDDHCLTVRSRPIVWWDQAVAPLPFFPSVCLFLVARGLAIHGGWQFARPGRIHRRDEAFVWIPSGVCGACGIVPRNCDIGQRGGLHGISTISLKWLRFSGFFFVHDCTVSEWMKCVCYRDVWVCLSPAAEFSTLSLISFFKDFQNVERWDFKRMKYRRKYPICN